MSEERPTPGAIADRVELRPPTTDELERVISALRRNPYHRSYGSLGAAARRWAGRAQVIVDGLIASGRVTREGMMFRLEGEPTPQRARESRRERNARKLRENRDQQERREQIDREFDALAAALGVGSNTTFRALHRTAAELGTPLSELLAGAEARTPRAK